MTDQHMLGPNMAGGARSTANSNPLSATSTSISIAAFTMQYGFGTVSYGSGSIAGLSPSTKYYVYCDDPGIVGGAVTYFATTNLQNIAAADGRFFIGAWTTPASGSGGTSEPPPEFCVAVDMWLGDYQAIAAQAGSDINILDDDCEGYHLGQIETVDFGAVPCVEIETVSGCRLICSSTTPITLRDGTTVYAPDSAGHDVAVLNDGFRWEEITSAQDAGWRQVAHVHIGGRTYAAGADVNKMIFTHNYFKP